MEWGTAPDWLVAVGTLGAFATGFRLLFREASRDKDRHEKDLRSQANRVAAWGYELDGNTSTENVELVVANRSQLPVYDAVIVHRFGDDEVVSNLSLGMISPRGTVRRAVYISEARWVPGLGTQPVVFGFTDAAGYRWLRDGTGRLFPGTRQNWNRVSENGVLYEPRPRLRRLRRLC